MASLRVHGAKAPGSDPNRRDQPLRRAAVNALRSLQTRLLALVLGVVALVWVATAVLTWLDVRHELDELLDGHLAQAAALLVAQQAGEIEDRDEHRALDAPSLHKYAPQVAFQVFHEGRLVLRSAGAPLLPMVPAQEQFRSGLKTVVMDDTAWRVFATHGSERDVQVYVGEKLQSRQAILWAVLRSTWLPMALALPMLALLAWWAIRRGLLPLRRLGVLLAARQAHSLQPLVLPGAPAELGPLLDALNGLFERIAVLLEGERRFTADAAHELRTPISAIRAQAQVALAEADEGPRRHALLATLAGCDRATRLVEQLLTLSRLEAEGATAGGRTDLSALARRVLADIAPRALAKGQVLDFDAPLPCPVAGDETLLAVLLRNLLDNAVRYSPAGARVQVNVAPQDGQVRLCVQDSGPGLTLADRARLGQRFHRPAGQAEPGSGLGWSIVRRIAAVQRLRLEVSASAALGGLAVEVWAPLSAPEAAAA